MKKIDINKVPKGMIAAIGIVVVFFVMFLFLVQRPANAKIAKATADKAALESEISRIKQGFGPAGTVEAVTALLTKKVKEFDNKFPPKEEIILRELSNLAASYGIQVTSITPQRKGVIADLNGTPVDVRGYFVKQMMISMNMSALYKKLGDFMSTLQDKFPIVMGVGDITMSSQDKEKGILNITLQLRAYMISQNAE